MATVVLMCPVCGHGMQSHTTGGHTWWSCLNSYCRKTITDKELYRKPKSTAIPLTSFTASIGCVQIHNGEDKKQ